MRTLHFAFASAVVGLGLAGCSGTAYIASDGDGGSGSASSGSASSGTPSSGATSSGTTSSGGGGSGIATSGVGGSGVATSGTGTSGIATSGGTTGSGSSSSGSGLRSCVSDVDCPNNGLCGYPEAAGCAATGVCFASPGAVCLAFSPGCACDGSQINVACTGLPSGYFSKALRHTGECTSVSDSGASADGGACVISASSYNQSCTVDSDCRMVSSGNYCSPTCLCGGSAINASAVAQYNEDVSKTPLGSGAFGNVVCGCPAESAACCRHGLCEGSFAACSVPADN
jgi:hypothetical protein